MLAGLLCGAYRKPAIFGALYKAWRTKVPSVSTGTVCCPQTRLVPAVDLHLTLPSQMKNCGQSHHVYLRGFLVAVSRCTGVAAGMMQTYPDVCWLNNPDFPSCSVHTGLKGNAGLFSAALSVCPLQLISSLFGSALLH